MEFQSLDAVTEEDDDFPRSCRNEVGRTYDRYRHSSSRVYEGRMGKLQYGKSQRTSSSKEGGHLPRVLTRSLSSAAPQQIQQNWVEVDLIDFGSPKAAVEEEEQGMVIDPEVLRELVKPFAESTKPQQPVADVFVSFLEYGQRDLLTGDGSFRNVDSLPLRSNSMRSTGSMSWSDSSDAEGTSNYHGDRVHIKDEDKGSPAARAYNRAFNKLMHKRNHKKPAVSDSVSTTPPLFSVAAKNLTKNATAERLICLDFGLCYHVERFSQSDFIRMEGGRFRLGVTQQSLSRLSIEASKFSSIVLQASSIPSIAT